MRAVRPLGAWQRAVLEGRDEPFNFGGALKWGVLILRRGGHAGEEEVPATPAQIWK
jgi:hypothetical protein